VWNAPRDHKVIGECLAEVRNAAGVTQQELAKRLRKPQSFVSSYESGQRRIDLLELVRIVDALGGNPRSVCNKIFDRIALAQKRSKARAS
jgi:transcriptional regulator with XRE-family HTH domain